MELKTGGVVVSRQEFVPATITVLNSEMEGSIYCPHTVAGTGESIQYTGLIRVESMSAEGVMKGSFKTDPTDNNPVTITDGSFELVVPVY